MSDEFFTHSLSLQRVHHLGAGPSALPLSVLTQAQKEIVTFPGAGMSPLELSHRSASFEEILLRAQQALAALYGLKTYGGGGHFPHEIIFMQGGASLQFSTVPLHYGAGGSYINTGTWSTRALEEAQLIWGKDQVQCLWSSVDLDFTEVPVEGLCLALQGNEPYLHYTSNNTIYGTQLRTHPKVNLSGIPFVIDASSDFISHPVDLSCCDLLYAGAQKNAGPAGVTIVLGKPDVVRREPADPRCPTTLRYQTHAKSNSLYHTPPTFSIYLVALVAEWALAQGGLDALNLRAKRRAQSLYQIIDRYPDLYQGHASVTSRSWMNITFRLPTAELETKFLKEAQALQLSGLKGHRSVGGIRASLYNAVTDEAVDIFAQHLQRFASAGS